MSVNQVREGREWMSADDIAGTGESCRHGGFGAERQRNKQDGSRGVAGCVTQLLQPL